MASLYRTVPSPIREGLFWARRLTSLLLREGWARGLNAYHHQRNKGDENPVRSYFPVSLGLFITQNCNLRCNHCQYLLQNPDHFSKDTDLSLDLLEEILRRTSGYLDHIALTAEGEPTMHREFDEVVRRCAAACPRVSLATNALTNVATYETLVRHLDQLMISLDGVDAASYSRTRGGNEKAFERVVDAIRQVQELRRAIPGGRLKRLSINFVIDREILHLMEPMIRFCEELGVDVARFNNFNPEGDLTRWQPLMGSDGEVIREYRRLTAITDWKVAVKLPKLLGIERQRFCHMLFNDLLINYQGNLTPCCHVPAHPRFGNIRDSEQAWNSIELQRFRQRFAQAHSLDELPPQCRYCHRRVTEKIRFSPRTGRWSGLEVLEEAERLQHRATDGERERTSVPLPLPVLE